LAKYWLAPVSANEKRLASGKRGIFMSLPKPLTKGELPKAEATHFVSSAVFCS